MLPYLGWACGGGGWCVRLIGVLGGSLGCLDKGGMEGGKEGREKRTHETHQTAPS